MKTIKLLIAEEKGELLEEISEIINKQPDMEIVGTAEDSGRIMKGLNSNPDIIILNPSILSAKELSETIHKIKKKVPKIGIFLILKRDMDDKSIMEALIDGVRGYIKRAGVSRILVDAIKSVSEGEVWAERRILNKFITGTPLIQKNIESKLRSLPNPLTRRETALIHEVLKGASNREISKKYKITEMTVKTHLYRIYKKMKVKSRAQAIAGLIYS